MLDGDGFFLVALGVEQTQRPIVERERHVKVREKNAAPLQLGNVVMGERSPLKPSAAERHTLQPAQLVLRMPNKFNFEDLFGVQLGGRQRFLGGCAADSADQRMVEKMLELLG